jgi:hypothetical protein
MGIMQGRDLHLLHRIVFEDLKSVMLLIVVVDTYYDVLIPRIDPRPYRYR